MFLNVTKRIPQSKCEYDDTHHVIRFSCLFVQATWTNAQLKVRYSSFPTLQLLSLEPTHFSFSNLTNNCTFCVVSSSRSLACSCCMRRSSSCCPWRRTSEALPPLGSTGELSGLRSFQEPIVSRPGSLLGREGLRTKSKLKADPKESEREARDFCQILFCNPYSAQQEWSNTPGHAGLNSVHGCSREVTYVCVCQKASVR